MTSHDHDHAHGPDHLHDHGHDHGHAHALASGTRAFAIATLINLAYTALEAGYGFATDSLALLSDAVHNFGDVLGLALAWGAAVMARRPPTGRHTYGWQTTHGRSAAAALERARTHLLFILDGLTTPDLRGSFLNLPDVRAVLHS